MKLKLNSKLLFSNGFFILVIFMSFNNVVSADSNNWDVEMYQNDNLEGTPVDQTTTKNINFYWGNTLSPAKNIPANTTFSATYKRNINVDEGAYNIITTANAGIRVYVDGNLYIDNWNDSGSTQRVEQALFLSKGKHSIRVDVKETAGEASLDFSLDDLHRDNRWYGVVFPNDDLSGQGSLTGYDPQIPNLNFDWGNAKSPASG
ncbi:PA14 domain-containing protein, partial [Salinibacillus kushneri]